ncbi:hypothetical protein Tco_0060774 [Tanacetum coccineum]
MNDDTPICECHEANYIQSEDYQNLDSHNSFSRQSHYDPNDSEKSLTVLNNDVRNDLKDFKRRIRNMRIVHWKLHNNNDGKTVITIHPYNTRSRGMLEQYHTLDEPTQEILDGTAGGIFLYKSPNQAFQFLRDKVLFKHDWPIKSKNKHHRKSVSFADGSDSNTDNSRFMEKLKVMDSPIISLNEELQDIRNKYNELREGNASKNHLNDDTPMCEQDEANYIQSEGHQNRISHDSYSHQSYHDRNDSEKSLTKLNNDVRNDLEDFKRCIHSMRTVHWKLFTRDNGKTPSVLPNIESKTVNQEPQSKTDLEKSITKFLDGQRVTNMFFKNNVNNMILKMKQNEKNFQTKIKNMERKMDEWEKYQNISFEQTYRTDPPPPQAHSEQVNAVFTERGKSDDSSKIQILPPIIVEDKPIKTSKGNYHMVKTK